MGTKHTSTEKERKLTFIDECQSYFMMLLSITRIISTNVIRLGGILFIPLFRMKNASFIRQVRCLID